MTKRDRALAIRGRTQQLQGHVQHALETTPRRRVKNDRPSEEYVRTRRPSSHDSYLRGVEFIFDDL